MGCPNCNSDKIVYTAIETVAREWQLNSDGTLNHDSVTEDLLSSDEAEVQCKSCGEKLAFYWDGADSMLLVIIEGTID